MWGIAKGWWNIQWLGIGKAVSTLRQEGGREGICYQTSVTAIATEEGLSPRSCGCVYCQACTVQRDGENNYSDSSHLLNTIRSQRARGPGSQSPGGQSGVEVNLGITSAESWEMPELMIYKCRREWMIKCADFQNGLSPELCFSLIWW